MLYRFKDTISSKDILIISPNKVFADFISNVLPELGEEKIPEVGIEKLAHELLNYKCKFQTFFEQASVLLQRDDKLLQERIQQKSSVKFLAKLDEYIAYIEKTHFCPIDLTVGGRLVPLGFMKECFEKSSGMPIFKRLAKIAKDVECNIGIRYHYDITAKERDQIKRAVKKMFTLSTLRTIYKEFYVWMGMPKLFKPIKGAIFEYADVFPLIYLKSWIEGIKNVYEDVRHLLVDEMQDYTPVQYAVLSMLFPCKKTILGDANQSVNPFSSSSSEKIIEIFPNADCVKLCKSYRSTYEITQFADKISPNKDLVAIERHGEAPDVVLCENSADERHKIIDMIKVFQFGGYPSLGIICKTQKQAEKLFEKLHAQDHKIHLLTEHSMVFRQGVVVCSVHMSKGLEFDHVIVSGVSA